MTEGIEGKVVVITGASSGLGEAAVRLLSEGGAKLVSAHGVSTGSRRWRNPAGSARTPRSARTSQTSTR